jgi:hypothetical protein
MYLKDLYPLALLGVKIKARMGLLETNVFLVIKFAVLVSKCCCFPVPV